MGYLPSFPVPETGGLGAALLVMLACTAFGSMIGGGGRRFPGADLVVGFGLAAGVLTILTVFTPLPVVLLFVLLGAAAIATLADCFHRRRIPGGLHFILVLAMLTPLFLIAAGTPAKRWDDFWTWLPNALYLYEFDSLAGPGLPKPIAGWPAYPQALPFLIAATSELAHRFLETAGPIANVALLASFAATLADAMRRIRIPDRIWSLLDSVAAAAGATAVCTILNPGLLYDIFLTSHAETATMVAVGVAALLGTCMLEDFACGRHADAHALAWRLGFVFAALVNLKQANPVLMVLLLAGLALLAVRDDRIAIAAAARLLPAVLAPALVVYATWRSFVARNLPGCEMHFAALTEWNFPQIGPMLAAIWGHMQGHPLFLGLMWLVTAAAIWSWSRLNTLGDRIIVLTAFCWLGYQGFMVLIYLGAMTADEAVVAAEYQRYMMHLELLAIAGITLRLASIVWPRWCVTALRTSVLSGAIILPTFFMTRAAAPAPGVTPWVLHGRRIGLDLADTLPPGSRVLIFTGDDHGELSKGIEYDLARRHFRDRAVETDTLWPGDDLDAQSRDARERDTTHLLVFNDAGQADCLIQPFGLPALNRDTSLFVRSADGWRRVRSWTPPPPG